MTWKIFIFGAFEIMKLKFVLFAIVIYGCSTQPPPTQIDDTGAPFSAPKLTGLIDDRLPEVSGIASSVVNPGYMWAQNDGQNPSEVFLIDTTGQVKMTCKLLVNNRDWEDIAVGPGPDSTMTYVYVGEIGDNKAQYDTKYVYRFEEPIADTTEKQITLTDTLRIQFPDGKRDSETMIIDPLTKDLYLISKREDSVGVYKVPQPYSKQVMIAQKVAVIPYTRIVAGSFSKDGLEILLKDYEYVYYWKRSKDESFEQALLRKPEHLPYEREAQGEAMTWTLNGSGYYTLSETNPLKPAYLRFYKRK